MSSYNEPYEYTVESTWVVKRTATLTWKRLSAQETLDYTHNVSRIDFCSQRSRTTRTWERYGSDKSSHKSFHMQVMKGEVVKVKVYMTRPPTRKLHIANILDWIR